MNAAVLQYAEPIPDNRPRCPVCAVPMWRVKIQHKFMEYMIAFLVLETMMIGTFCALDLVLTAFR